MDTLKYFQTEITRLREAAQGFSDAYPNVARELQLSQGRSSDPDVEQLIQSFAYLTGNLRRDLELQNNTVSQQLLLSLYPNLARSVPCMAVLQAQVDADGANFVNGARLSRGDLFAVEATDKQRDKKVECRFKACYETPLWPLKMNRCQLAPSNSYPELDALHKGQNAVISLQISNQGMEPLYEYPLQSLRFYLADSETRIELYQLLQTRLEQVVIKINERIIPLSKTCINWLGFDTDHSVLPQTGQHDSYRMLQEYFHFVDKFYFFDVNDIELETATEQFEILFLCSGSSEHIPVSKHSFKLNCFPAINLYEKTFKPIQWDYSQPHYRIIADEQQYLDTEVHQINQVREIEQNGQSQNIKAWIGGVCEPGRASYIEKLLPLLREGEPGCDTAISIHRAQLSPQSSVSKTLAIKGTCNNRRVPEWLIAGDKLQPVGVSAITSASLLRETTQFKSGICSGKEIQPLLAQLNLNLLSIADNEQGVDRLKRLLLAVCDQGNPGNKQQIAGFKSLTAEETVRRVGDVAWRGHCLGYRFTLHLEEHFLVAANIDLLGEILSRVLGLFTTVNHFTQLTITTNSTSREDRTWPPRIGEQIIL